MINDHLDDLRKAAAEEVTRLLDPAAVAPPPHSHRHLMASVKAVVVLALQPDAYGAANPPLVHAAHDWTSQLEDLQMPDGLFAGGDNIASPPDSAFTVNDVATTVRLLQHLESRWPDDLGERLTNILRSAAPGLVVGGVHTPNHRWELAAALAQCGVLLSDPTLVHRADAWLREGVDIDGDGLYSERSPNYAAHVSNPSLTILADLLDRPDLHDVVHRNLHAQLDLTDRAGRVETVHSRRQDQHAPFPLGPFFGQLVRAAALHSCTRCSGAAGRAVGSAGVDAVDVLAQHLLNPALGDPPSTEPGAPEPFGSGRRFFRDARLLRETREDAEFTVYGGSDVPAVGRVASGLANNPTFLRMRVGSASVESVRLSRDFFGLGPFRATEMTVIDDRVVLRELASASYYQPIPMGARRSDGRYHLEHEGRFAAAMSFADRSADVLTLTTTIDLHLHDDGVDLTITTDGPVTAHALEIALAPGGELAGVSPLGDGRHELTDGTARYTRGDSTLHIGPGHGTGPDRPPGYRPGEAYTFLGGTDAIGGTRLYVTWRSPGTVAVDLTACRTCHVATVCSCRTRRPEPRPCSTSSSPGHCSPSSR